MSKIGEAYCSTTHEIISARVLLRIEAKNNNLYKSQYCSNLFCPECRKAPVTLVHREHPFFRTYPNALHADDCGLTQDEMDKDELTEFVRTINKDEKSQAEVERQLNHVFLKLITDIPSESKIIYEPLTKKESKEGSEKLTVQRKGIPRRCITATLSEEDIGVYKIFYGRVQIRWENVKRGEGKKILVRSLDKKRFICRIILGPKVIHYMDDAVLTAPSGTYIVALFGKLEHEGDKDYYKCILNRSNYIQIAKMK